MLGSRTKSWVDTLPKPSAADMADYAEALRRAGMPDSIAPLAPAAMAPSSRIIAPSGMFGAAPTLPTNIAGDVPKPSFFAEGGTGRQIVGAIGDALSVAGGGRPLYLPLQLQKRQEERQDARLAQKQASDWQNWVRQQEYLRANPKPAQPTDLQRNYEWLKTFNPQAADSFLGTKTTAPPLVQRNADGTITVYPAGAVPRSGSSAVAAPPAEAVAELRRDPSAAAEFDEIFGAGAAARVLGQGQ